MRLWTTTWVRHFISTRFGIEYSRERVRQLLHALGVRLRRLRHRHLKAKPEEQATFRAELEELLVEWPAEWELLFVDEATVRRHPTLTAQWCVVDEGPEVPTGDDHAKVPVDGAVAPLTGRTHYQISPTLGKQEFAHFLQHLLAYHPGKQVLVIHDRGEQHQGAPVEAIALEAKGRLALKAQPAYSPELNPQERIWKWLRRAVTHHHGFETLTEQIEAIRNFFRAIARKLFAMKGVHHPGGSQPAFLTGLAHLYNLVPYQRRAQHARPCGVEVEGGRLPTRDWWLNLQILTSGGYQRVAETLHH